MEKEEKGPGTHCVCMCQGIKWGYSIVYSPFIIHRTAHHAKPANDHYDNATGSYGDLSTHVSSVYQALPPPREGPG